MMSLLFATALSLGYINFMKKRKKACLREYREQPVFANEEYVSAFEQAREERLKQQH